MPDSGTAKVRSFSAKALLIAALPLVFLGLIDPLEGGIALLLALATLTMAFLLAGYRPRKLLWLPFVLAITVGIVTLLFAMFGLNRVDNQPPMIPLIALLWLYRALVVVTLVGLVLEVIRAFKLQSLENQKDFH